MRILIIVPTKHHIVSAGTRIRYDRIRAKADYFDVSIQSLESLSSDELDQCDVCIFSKTYSVGAIAIAGTLRKRGVIVGVDLFDDYFSQEDDSRLTVFRSWLRRFASVFQFALCSTETMRRVVVHNAPDLPVHVVPDPFPQIDPARLQNVRERTRTTGIIDVVWFGIGSNPFFPVGLQDLSAYAWSLAELDSGNARVNLTILTDDVSLTPENLIRLKQLPVPYEIRTWSLEAERAALSAALVAFVPVNGQSFSRAKSPNRALTAISNGAQVLSPGFPLYRNLESLIYTEAAELRRDIEAGTCRISSDRSDEVRRIVAQVSDLDAILVELFLFLVRQRRAAAPSVGTANNAETPSTHALVFANKDELQMVEAGPIAKVVSVRSPYARDERTYDIRLELLNEYELDVWVRPELVPYLDAPLQGNLSQPAKIGKIRMQKLTDRALLRLPQPLPVMPGQAYQIVYESVAYRKSLADLLRVCRNLFPSLEFCVSGLPSYQGFDRANQDHY